MAAKKSGGSHPTDPDVSVAGKNASDYTVVQNDDGVWYDAILNQCNIGGNNNKYYRLQCLTDGSLFYAWFRWGRVGEPSRATASTWLGPYSSAEGAIKEFCKKYRAKSANAFGADTFVPKKGKYALIEVDNDVEVSEEYKVIPPKKKQEIEYMKPSLDPKTKDLIEVLFSKDMRNEALASFNLDLKRLPLGVPSQEQINQGVAILNDIEEKLKGNGPTDSFEDLSSRFYTAIPHSFGRSRPPVIADTDSLRSRFDMCNVLLDMYSTTETVKRIEAEQQEQELQKKVLPHPVDQHFKSLQADLSLVDSTSTEYKIISEYYQKTRSQHSRGTLLNVWTVDRNGEADRFSKFDKLDNRCLLWHGTNIAVVAPILTSGLRIMPHSGGRVGSGIYLAGMHEKSAQYTSGYGAKFACMFLCEAPLGKQHIVNQDGPHAYSLKKAPAGFDSVHAIGNVQPEKWTTLSIDDKEVKVPQGTGKPRGGSPSSFHHDEFLVYEEAQVRIRYVLTVKLH